MSMSLHSTYSVLEEPQRPTEPPLANTARPNVACWPRSRWASPMDTHFTCPYPPPNICAPIASVSEPTPSERHLARGRKSQPPQPGAQITLGPSFLVLFGQGPRNGKRRVHEPALGAVLLGGVYKVHAMCKVCVPRWQLRAASATPRPLLRHCHPILTFPPSHGAHRNASGVAPRQATGVGPDPHSPA